MIHTNQKTLYEFGKFSIDKFQVNCILREDKTEKSVNLEMSSEYLFSSISDGDTSNSSTGILWSNIYITKGYFT